MFRERYKKAMSQIAPKDETINKIIENSKKQDYTKPIKKWRCLPVAAALIIITSVPVMAYMGYLDKVKQSLGEETNNYITAQETSIEKNGIKLQIYGATKTENFISIYGSLQDTQGSRITKDAEFFRHSMYADGNASKSSSWDYGYDEKDKKLTFKLTSQFDDVLGSDVNFNASCILSNRKEYNSVSIPMEIDNNPDITEEVTKFDDNTNENRYHSFGVKHYGDEEAIKAAGFDGNKKYGILTPKETNIPISKDIDKDIDFFSFNTAGFINGYLYVNLSFKDRTLERTNIIPYLVDKNGKKVECFYSKEIADTKNNLPEQDEFYYNLRDYEQYIFDIDEAEAENYSLYADIVYYETEINDMFSLNIDIDSISENAVILENVPLGDKTIVRLEINPMCVIGAVENNIASNNYWGKLIYNDGKIDEFSCVIAGDGIYNSYGGFVCYPEKYIDLKNLEEVKINNITVYKRED